LGVGVLGICVGKSSGTAAPPTSPRLSEAVAYKDFHGARKEKATPPKPPIAPETPKLRAFGRANSGWPMVFRGIE
jgi:hypothetical protein